jgi:exosome complex RNA-binding protein Rrp4
MVHLFATEAAGLAAKLRSCRAAIGPDGMIWVSWPKKSSGVASDLTDVVVRDTAVALGLVDIKVCAIDEVWSGLKFVIPRDKRKSDQRVKRPK